MYFSKFLSSPPLNSPDVRRAIGRIIQIPQFISLCLWHILSYDTTEFHIKLDWFRMQQVKPLTIRSTLNYLETRYYSWQEILDSHLRKLSSLHLIKIILRKGSGWHYLGNMPSVFPGPCAVIIDNLHYHRSGIAVWGRFPPTSMMLATRRNKVSKNKLKKCSL